MGIDDIEGLVDSQDVADSPNMHDHHHMAAYRVVDTAREAVDTPDDLGSLKSILDLIIIVSKITLRMIARMPSWMSLRRIWSGRSTLMSRSTRCIRL